MGRSGSVVGDRRPIRNRKIDTLCFRFVAYPTTTGEAEVHAVKESGNPLGMVSSGWLKVLLPRIEAGQVMTAAAGD